jgi:hypothetical protein
MPASSVAWLIYEVTSARFELVQLESWPRAYHDVAVFKKP